VFSVGKVYGDAASERDEPTVANDASLLQAIQDGNADALHFMRALALCNTVTPLAVAPEIEHLSARAAAGAGNGAEGADGAGEGGRGDKRGRGRGGGGGGGLGGVYEAASPDEEALVEAAAAVGVALEGRTNDTVSIALSAAAPGLARETETFRIMRELEFTSNRKRMSVVLQRVPGAAGGVGGAGGAGGGGSSRRLFGGGSGARGAGVCAAGVGGEELFMFTKGADDAVRPFLAPGQEAIAEDTQAHIEDFATFGLRTLLVAWRPVTRAELSSWENGPLKEANASLEGRDAR
jgi:hypothetical protein